MKQNYAIIFGIIIMIIISSGCIWSSDSPESEKVLYLEEVHEWGVFIQNYSNNEVFLSGGPMPDFPEIPNTTPTIDKKPDQRLRSFA